VTWTRLVIPAFCGLLLACQQQEVKRQPIESGLDTTLVHQGISFWVACANQSALDTVRVTPAGLEIDNRAQERAIDGTVTGVEVADLNRYGSPEVYVFVTSAGSGSYGSVVGYSANRKNSMSDVYLPSLLKDGIGIGYMGHDRFTIEEDALVRRFPIYLNGDTNANPTGGMREVHYQLVAGEAGWCLEMGLAIDLKEQS